MAVTRSSFANSFKPHLFFSRSINWGDSSHPPSSIPPNQRPKNLRPSHRSQLPWINLSRSSTDLNGRCFRCTGLGHRARFCNRPIVCFLCGNTGHLKSSCRISKSCYLCGKPGHLKVHCINFQGSRTKSLDLETHREVSSDWRFRVFVPDPMLEDNVFLPIRDTHVTNSFLDPMMLDPVVIMMVHRGSICLDSMIQRDRHSGVSDGDFGQFFDSRPNKDSSDCQERLDPVEMFHSINRNGVFGMIHDLEVKTAKRDFTDTVEYAEGELEIADEDPMEEVRHVQEDSTIPMEFLDQRPISLNNVFILDELTPDSCDSSIKDSRSIFYYVDPYKFYLHCAIQGFRIVAQLLNLSPSSILARKKKLNRSSRVCLIPSRRSPRLHKSK